MKYSTKVSYRTTAEVDLLPFFGKMLLSEIGASDIAAFQRHLSTGKRSPKTVRNIVAVLTAAMRVAVDWDLIDSVPSVRRVKVPLPEYRFLNREEMRALLAAANDTWESAFRFTLLSGLRLGEVRALCFEQVNFDTGEIFVDRAVWRKVQGTPKHGKKRTVTVSQTALACLDWQRRSNSGLVFPKVKGGIRGQHWCCEALYTYSDRAGIGRHVLRHTYATNMAATGVLIPVLQQQLGHKDISTTMRYAHVVDDGPAKAAAALDRFMSGGSGPYLGIEAQGGDESTKKKTPKT